jgi:CRISPR-associated protein Cas1
MISRPPDSFPSDASPPDSNPERGSQHETTELAESGRLLLPDDSSNKVVTPDTEQALELQDSGAAATSGSLLPTLDLEDLFSGEGENAVESLEELIPARMLNEFTYCPRLAYLEWVQGEFRENLETREGTFGHRKVDKPTRKSFALPQSSGDEDDSSRDARLDADAAEIDVQEQPLPPGALPADSLAARALLLSAPSEGLIAKLDLIELAGYRAVPIDYKRGTIPENAHQAWEPERVQLCAQGLILKANGYECDYGELYYIESRSRVKVWFDDALIRRTRELLGDMRRMATQREMPPPLVDSPKCPRCSLVSICLPDETNWLRESRESDDALPSSPSEKKIRRLIPSKDEGLPLYIQEQGAYVGKEGERLRIKPVKDPIKHVGLMHVSQLCLLGNVQLTASALRELSDRNIPICHFSYGGWFTAMTTAMSHKNVELRMAQSKAAFDPKVSLRISKGFIAAKIRNCRTLLRRHAEDRYKLELDQLNDYIRKVERVDSKESLLGIEGMAAKIYFGGFARLPKGGETFQLTNRNRRPPTDPINALLSFVYSLLTKELTITLQAVGFDPFLGFLHQPRYGRPSLALDLAEEFRPIVADSVVLTLINNEEVSPKSFISRAGSVALTDAGRKAVIANFERRMETEITHPIFAYKASYRRILEVQARLLSRVLLGELDEYPGFCTR